MKRRRLLLGAGAALSSGAAVIGSGAFSTVEADRRLEIGLETDRNAYLQIEDISDYAKTEDGVVTLVFDGNAPPIADGEGLGTDSIYEFGSVLFVQNHGDRTVKLFGEYDDDAVSDVKLTQSTDVNESDGGNGVLTEANPSDPLDPGDAIEVGVVVDTGGMSVGTVDTSLTIVAASDDSDLRSG